MSPPVERTTLEVVEGCYISISSHDLVLVPDQHLANVISQSRSWFLPFIAVPQQINKPGKTPISDFLDISGEKADATRERSIGCLILPMFREIFMFVRLQKRTKQTSI